MKINQLPSCPLCKSNAKIKYIKKSEEILTCKNKKCKLKFKITGLTKKNVQKFYTQNYYSKHRKYFPTPADVFNQILEKINKIKPLKKLKILDFGCGEALMYNSAKKYKLKYFGIENNNKAIKKARRLSKNIYKNLKEVKNQKFDVIIMINTLEHLKDPLKTLTELRKLIKNNGLLYISTTRSNSLKEIIFNGKTKIIQDPTHLYFFNEKNIKILLSKSNFKLICFNIFIRYSKNIFKNILQFFLIKIKKNSSINLIAMPKIYKSAENEI